MRKISFWASHHIWISRLMIVFFIYPLLNFTGWIVGDLLSASGIFINLSAGWILSIICLILFALYPRKRSSDGKHFYNHRKWIHMALAACTFCFVVLSGNQSGIAESSFSSHATEVLNKNAGSHIKPSLKKEKKKFFKKLIRDFRNKYKKSDDAGKAALIALAVLVALLLIVLLGSLACSIACSGSEALAYIVFFVGLAGIIFLLVRLIRRISKGPAKPTVTTPTKET
jgi:hypothetical protein